ncbi:hypothetical protein HZS_7649 [Henneguya salminicola]|nr:hypothetical protein HZS_7649 [Henneguya salminicola]
MFILFLIFLAEFISLGAIFRDRYERNNQQKINHIEETTLEIPDLPNQEKIIGSEGKNPTIIKAERPQAKQKYIEFYDVFKFEEEFICVKKRNRKAFGGRMGRKFYSKNVSPEEGAYTTTSTPSYITSTSDQTFYPLVEENNRNNKRAKIQNASLYIKTICCTNDPVTQTKSCKLCILEKDMTNSLNSYTWDLGKPVSASPFRRQKITKPKVEIKNSDQLAKIKFDDHFVYFLEMYRHLKNFPKYHLIVINDTDTSYFLSKVSIFELIVEQVWASCQFFLFYMLKYYRITGIFSDKERNSLNNIETCRVTPDCK